MCVFHRNIWWVFRSLENMKRYVDHLHMLNAENSNMDFLFPNLILILIVHSKSWRYLSTCYVNNEIPVHTPLLSIGLSGISKSSIDIVKSSKLVKDRKKSLHCEQVTEWRTKSYVYELYSCKVTCLFNKSMPPDYSDWHNVMNSLNTFGFRQRRRTFYSTRNFADLDQYHIWSHDR